MNTKALLLIAIPVTLAALIYGYTRQSREKGEDEEGDRAITAPSRVETGTNGETVVSLDLSTQKLVGLQTATLTADTQAPEVKVYGRVMDPTPLEGQWSQIASAQAALEASGREYQRLESLFEQGQNASAKALETAEASMKHDQVALKLAEAQLVAAWGRPVADQPDLSAFVQSLVQRDTVLVRLDLPAGQSLAGVPIGARLILPGATQPIPAHFLAGATSTDPQVQGQGFLFQVTNTVARLTPGLAVTGFLQLPGEPLHGVIVPNAAIVRASERAWVYAQTGDTTFTRHEIALQQPVSDGWFVTHGATAGDRVVVVGAQTLLSEERKTQIQVGD